MEAQKVQEGGYTCQGGETYESLLQANKDLWSNVADLSHVELILVDCPGDYAVCNKVMEHSPAGLIIQ